jgi:tetratricopeptide (TPR) repeat protein
VTVADRWFYFPFVGLLGMLGIIYNAFFERLKTKKLITNLILILSVILILLLSALTIVRNSQWQTSSQLYSHDEKYAGESAELEAYLGEIFVANGQLNTAKIRFEKAISFDPMGDSLNGLAYVYEQQKNYTKAKKLYWQNIKLSNGLPKYISYEGLTRIALIDEHNPWEAKQLSKAAFVLYPNDEALIKLLAFSEYFTKDKTEALETFRKLLNIVPNQENQKIYLMMENNKLTY